jgi:hypothetical protein
MWTVLPEKKGISKGLLLSKMRTYYYCHGPEMQAVGRSTREEAATGRSRYAGMAHGPNER